MWESSGRSILPGPISGRSMENWRRNNTFYFGDGGVLSSDGKNQRSPGTAFGEHLRAAGAHRRLVPGPLFYGGRLPESWAIASGGQNLSGLSFLPSGHWALSVQNLVDKCAEITPPTLAQPGRQGSFRRADNPYERTMRSVGRGGCPHPPARLSPHQTSRQAPGGVR